MKNTCKVSDFIKFEKRCNDKEEELISHLQKTAKEMKFQHYKVKAEARVRE